MAGDPATSVAHGNAGLPTERGDDALVDVLRLGQGRFWLRLQALGQLSSDMGIDPSAMVKLINELEEAGLAERRRRPSDRRAWEVVITAKGRRTLGRARRLATQVEDEVLGGLTVTDRRRLLTLLRRALASAPPQPPWRADEGTEQPGKGQTHAVSALAEDWQDSQARQHSNGEWAAFNRRGDW